MDGFGVIVLILLGFFLYFLPSIVGYNKRNAAGIIVLNIFLGWTFLGWIIALVWASTSDPPRPMIYNDKDTFRRPEARSDGDRFDNLKKLKELLDAGAITEAEYVKEKEKILSK